MLAAIAQRQQSQPRSQPSVTSTAQSVARTAGDSTCWAPIQRTHDCSCSGVPKTCHFSPCAAPYEGLTPELEPERRSARLSPREMHARAVMKTCAQCRGKLGLGVRARNVWNGRWWVHLRFCSVRCEEQYQLERYNANTHSWRTVLDRRPCVVRLSCRVSSPKRRRVRLINPSGDASGGPPGLSAHCASGAPGLPPRAATAADQVARLARTALYIAEGVE